MSEPYYRNERAIFRRPQESPGGVTMGFLVCEVNEFVETEPVLAIFNSHDDLVRSVEELLAWSKSVEGTSVQHFVTNIGGSIFSDARAALAKAKQSEKAIGR